MRVLVVNRPPSRGGPDPAGFDPVREALLRAGHEVHTVTHPELTVSAGHAVEITALGRPVSADAAFVRGGGLYIPAALEALGIKVVNGWVPRSVASDKWLTHVALAKAGVSQIPTHLLLPLSPPPALTGTIVIKQPVGTNGEGVSRCPPFPTPWNQETRIAQPLLDGDTEWRVLVADGRIVAWERRVARPGEWRANVSLGATVSRPDLPEAVAELAVAAHVAIDLDYSGVDVLVHEEVAMVIELSASPAWEGAYSLWHDALFELYTTALASCLRRARDADPFQAA